MRGREKELMNRIIDEKENVKMLEEEEKQECQEKFRKNLEMKDVLGNREKKMDKKVRDCIVREREIDRREKELDQFEHKKSPQIQIE